MSSYQVIIITPGFSAQRSRVISPNFLNYTGSLIHNCWKILSILSNYTPRVRRKYILCKVKLGSTVVCNSLEPSIHAGSQPFRYVSAGSTYCHYDPHLKYPTPSELHSGMILIYLPKHPPGRIPNLPLHKDIFMCYICANCRRSLR